jgi:hypothetical protein
MAEGEKVKKKLRLPKTILLVVGVLLIIALIAVGAYFYLQYKKTQDLLKNPVLGAQIESQNLVSKVGALMELPKDEQPTVATVSDVSKLKDQPFFAKAKNGYKVLIYSKAQKAILYDPVANKLIEVGPVNIGSQNPTTAPTTEAPVKIALYNGTATVGLTSAIEKQLKDNKINVDVVEKANASSSAYAKTMVVDLTADKAGLSGKQTALVKQLAALLSGEVGTLPDGEKKPKDAEILVILGK